jgi:hypothetical protein
MVHEVLRWEITPSRRSARLGRDQESADTRGLAQGFGWNRFLRQEKSQRRYRLDMPRQKHMSGEITGGIE